MKRTIRTKTYALNYWYAQHAQLCFAVVLACFLAAFSAYVYFVVSSLSSGVAYQKIRHDIASTDARIAQLEGERIGRMRVIDIAFAKERGFVEVTPTRYIAAADSALKLSMLTSER